MRHDLGWLYGEVPELSLWQKLVLKLSGQVFVGYRRPEGYRMAVPVYVVKCPVHGLFLDTLHGFSGYFQCSGCLAEGVARRTYA